MRKILGNLALITSGVVLGLGMAEVVLRISSYTHPSFYIVDDDLGAALRPNATGWRREEGEAYIRINSAGQRDDTEHALAKPPTTLRVAVLGDSYAEGSQLPAEMLFWKILEHRLSGCLPRNVEVLNFGVSGYGTGQEFLVLKHRVKSYSPDVVLMATFLGNDIRNNHRALEKSDEIPYFVLRDGALLLDASFRSDPNFIGMQWRERFLYGPFRNVRLLQLARQFRERSISSQNGPRQKDESPLLAEPGLKDKNPPPAEPGLDDAIYMPPEDQAWREAWAITEALISAADKEVRAMGARFFLVTLSNGIQVHPDPGIRNQYMKGLGIEGLFYPDTRILNYARAQGIEVMTLAPLLKDHAEQNRVYLHGFANTRLGTGHWNAEGHRIAGEHIAARLCRTLE